MATNPADKMTRTLKRAIKADGRSLYRIAKLSRLHYSILDRFVHEERLAITLPTIAALCDVVGLELRPIRKGR